MNRRVPVQRCSSQPETTEYSGRCNQVHGCGETTICLATILFFFRSMCGAKAAGSPYILADWSSGPVARTHYEWCPLHRRMWSVWTWLLNSDALLFEPYVPFKKRCDRTKYERVFTQWIKNFRFIHNSVFIVLSS